MALGTNYARNSGKEDVRVKLGMHRLSQKWIMEQTAKNGRKSGIVKWQTSMFI